MTANSILEHPNVSGRVIGCTAHPDDIAAFQAELRRTHARRKQDVSTSGSATVYLRVCTHTVVCMSRVLNGLGAKGLAQSATNTEIQTNCVM